MIDINKLTVGEIAKVEELSNQGITAIVDDASPKGLTMAALAFVVKRRENGEVKWNDALALTFEEANAILGLGQDEPEVSADPLDED